MEHTCWFLLFYARQIMSQLKEKIFANICSSFGLGYFPVASGTIGSAPAIFIFIIIVLVAPSYLHTALIAVVLLTCCGLCILLGPWAERYWKKKDPRQFVLDEYAGFFFTVLLFRVPSLTLTVIWGFIMTRIFDILKPPPASRLEVLSNGWGILLDDLVASLYAAFALHILAIYFPRLFGE